MSFRGHVRNGVVVFDEGVVLPEGAVVRVEPIEAAEPLSLFERFGDVVGQAEGLPPDAAVNVDHYLYALPPKP